MTRLRRALEYGLPLIAPWLLLLAVNRTGTPAPLARSVIPQEPFVREHCTWACHNHGCHHRPRLPLVLAGDAGLYGATIRALQGAGRAASHDAHLGYGAVNLLAFCVLWPGAMYVLLQIGLRQRAALRELRAPRDEGGPR